MQKCTTCAERGDDVRCVLVEHQGDARAKQAKAALAAATQQQQVQGVKVLDDEQQFTASPAQMADSSLMVLQGNDVSSHEDKMDAVPQSQNQSSESAVLEGYAPPTIIIRRIVSPVEVKEMFRMYVPSR